MSKGKINLKYVSNMLNFFQGFFFQEKVTVRVFC